MPRSVSGEETSRIGPPLLPGTGKRCTDGTRPEPSSDGLPAGFTPVAIIGDRGESVCTARSFPFRRVPGRHPSRGNAPKKRRRAVRAAILRIMRKGRPLSRTIFPGCPRTTEKPDNGPKGPAPYLRQMQSAPAATFAAGADPIVRTQCVPSFTPLSGRRRDYQPST